MLIIAIGFLLVEIMALLVKGSWMFTYYLVIILLAYILGMDTANLGSIVLCVCMAVSIMIEDGVIKTYVTALAILAGYSSKVGLECIIIGIVIYGIILGVGKLIRVSVGGWQVAVAVLITIWDAEEILRYIRG
jgi:hypothetical protein